MKGTCKHLASFEKEKAKNLSYKMVIISALAQGHGIFILHLSTFELEMTYLGPSPLGWLPRNKIYLSSSTKKMAL